MEAGIVWEVRMVGGFYGVHSKRMMREGVGYVALRAQVVVRPLSYIRATDFVWVDSKFC